MMKRQWCTVLLYSFDVFDTLITRTTASPEGIFLLMQYYMKNQDAYDGMWRFAEHFPFLRIEAEKNARRFHPQTEISIKDIYDAMGQSISLSQEEKNDLAALEERCELACAAGIKSGIDQVKQLRAEQKKVILISDMYLSSDIIRRMLVKADSIFQDIPLYVSSEYGVTKSNGLLYAEVQKQEKTSYNQWIHYGDNAVSDVNIPRLFGIRAYLAETDSMPAWEQAAADSFHLKSDLMFQITLGITKKLRRKGWKERSRAFQAGASCASFILFPYVKWVLKSAVEQNISSLYFISRDGYVLKRIADIYGKEYRLNIKTKYIYGSRQAWNCEDTAQQDLVRQYFCQEADAAGGSAAFVDIHGTGRSAGRLADLLGRRLKFYFYVLLEPPYDKNCDFSIYSAEPYNGMIEVFCRAPHGAVLGYQRKGQAVVPRLAKSSKRLWEACGFHDYISGIEEFVREMTAVCRNLEIDMDLSEIGRWMLAYCSETPDRIIAGFIGSIPHNDGNREQGNSYAPPLSRKEIVQTVFYRTTQHAGQFYRGSDLQYSYKQLSQKDQKFLALCERSYYGLPGKVIHLPYKKWKERMHHKLLRHKKLTKVIVYAAGRYGREVYHRLRYAEGIKITAWVDADHLSYQKQNDPVAPISAIKSRPYDRIVISVDSAAVSVQIKNMLSAAGIDSSRIKTWREFMREYFHEGD